MKFAPLGESAVLIETGLLPDLAAPVVRQWVRALEGGMLEGVFEVVPAFTAVGIFYDAARLAREHRAAPFVTVCRWAESRVKMLAAIEPAPIREFVVPVCYAAEFGPDLEEVARATQLSPEAVVRLHASTDYEVRAVGFSPGFPYLAGLPEELHVPRRPTPRTKVPAGSVGIGGAQTGIYSLTTPGGWNLIGRTPWVLFDPTADVPSLFQIGDRVRFEAINAEAMATANPGPLKARSAASPRESTP